MMLDLGFLWRRLGLCTHPTFPLSQTAFDAVEEATAQKQQFDAQLAKANTDAYGMKVAWDKASGHMQFITVLRSITTLRR